MRYRSSLACATVLVILVGFSPSASDQAAEPPQRQPEPTLAELREQVRRLQGVISSQQVRIESLEAHVREVAHKHKVRIDLGKIGGRCVFCHDPHSLE